MSFTNEELARAAKQADTEIIYYEIALGVEYKIEKKGMKNPFDKQTETKRYLEITKKLEEL